MSEAATVYSPIEVRSRTGELIGLLRSTIPVNRPGVEITIRSQEDLVKPFLPLFINPVNDAFSHRTIFLKLETYCASKTCRYPVLVMDDRDEEWIYNAIAFKRTDIPDSPWESPDWSVLSA